VIVPLIGLRQDILRRYKELGIEYDKWKAGQVSPKGQMVFVTPEAVFSDGFWIFINRIKSDSCLDRIIINECYIILNE
jgi:hypothetical protein